MLPFSHFPATVQPHFLSYFCFFPVIWLNASRVRQVPWGESQSCRNGPQPTVAPQWRPRCGAGNPQPQEARQAGGHFARHVDLTSDPQPKTQTAQQHHLRTDWHDTKTHPPPFWSITTLFSYTTEICTCCPLWKGNYSGSLLNSDKKGKPRQIAYLIGHQMDLAPVVSRVRDCACFILFLYMWRISFRLLWTAELHVAANPKKTTWSVIKKASCCLRH